MKIYILAGLGAIALSGCTQLVHELKSDPAIVGITGFWFQVGADVTPTSGGMPLPNLKFGHGTIWRVGLSDNVTIKVGEIANSPAAVAPAPAGTTENLKGQASLEITTTNTSKAIEALGNIEPPK